MGRESLERPSHDPVVIAMGSNLAAERHLPMALDRLRAACEVVAVSSVYRTPPIGSPGAPSFLNLAVRIGTRLSPLALKLELLRPIEEGMGRVRTANPNAPRTIDLDITLFGDLVIEDLEHGLVLPDPEILTRAHVVLPLADLVPGFLHPLAGRTIAEIASVFAAAPGVRIVDGLDLGEGSGAGG